MARFLKIKLYNTSVDSGTTTDVPAGANDLIDAGQSFTTTVSPGDYVVAGGVVYVVSAIVDNENLTLESGTVSNGTAYTIYAGDAYTERIVSAENVMYTSRTDAYNTVIKYNHAQAAVDTLTLTHTTDANVEYVVDTINDVLDKIHSGKTYPEVVTNLVPEVTVVTGVFS